MDETAGIYLAGSVRAIARVEPGPTAESGRVRRKNAQLRGKSLGAKIEKSDTILQRYCNGFD